MKKIVYLFIFGLLIVVAFFIACGRDAPEVSPSLTDEPQPSVPENSITGGAIGGPIEEKAEEPIQTSFYNNRIQELMDKAKAINNYRFHYRTIYLNANGLYLEDPAYEVLVRDNKAKKIYFEAKKSDPMMYYNEVYLDFSQKTAFGVCSLAGITCRGLKDIAYRLNYGEEKYQASLLETLAEIPTNAKTTGTTLFNNRQAIIVEFKLPTGNMKRLFLDNFYGLPLKEEEYKITENGELIILSRDFTPLVAGSGTVKTTDVNLPTTLTVSN